MTYDLNDAVVAGARKLDVDVPGWWNRVSADTLDLASYRECVLGQIFGGYSDGCQYLFGGEWSFPAVDHGFFPNVFENGGVSDEVYEDACTALTLAWSYEINARILAEMLDRPVS